MSTHHSWRNINGDIMDLTDESAFNMSLVTMGKGLSPEDNRRLSELVPDFDRDESKKSAYLACIHMNWHDDKLDDPESAEDFFYYFREVSDGKVHLIGIESDELACLGAWYCKRNFPDLYEMATSDDFADAVRSKYNSFYDGDCLRVEFDFEAYGQKLLNEYKVIETEWGLLSA